MARGRGGGGLPIPTKGFAPPHSPTPGEPIGLGVWVAGMGLYTGTDLGPPEARNMSGRVVVSSDAIFWTEIDSGLRGPDNVIIGSDMDAGIQSLSYANGVFVAGGQGFTSLGLTQNLIATSILGGKRWESSPTPFGYVGPAGQGLLVGYAQDYFNDSVSFSMPIAQRNGFDGTVLVARPELFPDTQPEETWPWKPTEFNRFAPVYGVGGEGPKEVRINAISVPGGITHVLEQRAYGSADWILCYEARIPGFTDTLPGISINALVWGIYATAVRFIKGRN